MNPLLTAIAVEALVPMAKQLYNDLFVKPAEEDVESDVVKPESEDVEALRLEYGYLLEAQYQQVEELQAQLALAVEEKERAVDLLRDATRKLVDAGQAAHALRTALYGVGQ